jgi:hypothetical protein
MHSILIQAVEHEPVWAHSELSAQTGASQWTSKRSHV